MLITCCNNAVIKVLLSSEVPEGLKALKSDPLFSEISDVLKAVVEKVPCINKLFHPLRHLDHPNQVLQIPDDPLGSLLLTEPPCCLMSCEYFSLIGTLSSSYDGTTTLQRHSR